MTLSESAEASGSRTSRSRVISNSLNSAASYVIWLPVNLVVTAFVVHRIGLASYGIWAALTTILGFGSLLDLGVTTPLVKYVADSLALGRRDEVNVLLSTAMVFYCAAGTIFLAGMTLASGWILVHMFHASPGDASLRALYLAILIGFVASLTFSVLTSLLVGLQRVDISARLVLGFNLLSSVAIVVTLNLGFGVTGLGISWLLITALTIGANWFVAKRLFEPLTLNPMLFRWSYLKRILRFSTRVQITTLTLVLNQQVDRTLIASVLGPRMLGFYALAARAASAIDGLSHALMTGILPATSDLVALNQRDRLHQLYFRSSRYLAIVDLGLCAGAGGLAIPLLHAWQGPGFARSATTLMIILAGFAIWLPSQATTDPLYALERPEIRMRADVAFLMLHIPLSLVLLWRFGYFGTVAGTTLALASTRIYVYVAGAHALGTSVWNLFRRSFLHPILGAVVGLVVVIPLQLSGAPLSIPMLLLEGALFGAAYIGYIAVFGLDSYDRGLVQAHFLIPVRRFVSRFGAAT